MFKKNNKIKLYLLIYSLFNSACLCASSCFDDPKNPRNNCGHSLDSDNMDNWYKICHYYSSFVGLTKKNGETLNFFPLQIEYFTDLDSNQKDKIISTLIEILSNPRLEEYLTEPEELVSMQPKERMMFKLKRYMESYWKEMRKADESIPSVYRFFTCGPTNSFSFSLFGDERDSFSLVGAKTRSQHVRRREKNRALPGQERISAEQKSIPVFAVSFHGLDGLSEKLYTIKL